MGLLTLFRAWAVRRPWVSNHTAQRILAYTHYASPIILLALFLTAFTTYSIVTAPTTTVTHPSTDQAGPGGKPLPKKKTRSCKNTVGLDFSPARKRLFIGLLVGVILTLIASAAVVITHSLWDREANWWCGEAAAVCTSDMAVKSHMQRANVDRPRFTS